jgi:hypothetical protein
VNWSAGVVVLVPAGVVTLTSTVPVPAGEVAVIWLELTTVTLVAAAPPKVTEVAPVKLEPLIVTDVPPAAAPLVGEIEETTGAGGGVV